MLKLALVQMRVDGGRPAENLRRAGEFIAQAAKAGARWSCCRRRWTSAGNTVRRGRARAGFPAVIPAGGSGRRRGRTLPTSAQVSWSVRVNIPLTRRCSSIPAAKFFSTIPATARLFCQARSSDCLLAQSSRKDGCGHLAFQQDNHETGKRRSQRRPTPASRAALRPAAVKAQLWRATLQCRAHASATHRCRVAMQMRLAGSAFAEKEYPAGKCWMASSSGMLRQCVSRAIHPR